MEINSAAETAETFRVRRMNKSWDETWNYDFRVHDGSLAPQNPSLITLREKGYEIGMYGPTYDDGEEPKEEHMGNWWANKDSHEFVAGTPLELLGLVALWEARGDDWCRDNDPDIYSKILDETSTD